MKEHPPRPSPRGPSRSRSYQPCGGYRGAPSPSGTERKLLPLGCKAAGSRRRPDSRTFWLVEPNVEMRSVVHSAQMK
jgi:hypothetical protein